MFNKADLYTFVENIEMNVPSGLKYTKDHEWLKLDGETAIVGITDFAQSELGDIVFVEVDSLNSDVEKEGVFGSIEAVKTVSDLFMPVTGEIVEFNEELESNPELVNSDPYGKGWIVKVRIQNSSELDELLTAEEYSELIG